METRNVVFVQEKHPSVVEHGFSEERIRREFALAGLINVDVKPRAFLMSKSMPAAYGWKSISLTNVLHLG
jgi:hypothetical protein